MLKLAAVLALLVSPYVPNVLPLLAVAGFVCFYFLATSFLMQSQIEATHDSNFVGWKRRQIPGLKLPKLERIQNPSTLSKQLNSNPSNPSKQLKQTYEDPGDSPLQLSLAAFAAAVVRSEILLPAQALFPFLSESLLVDSHRDVTSNHQINNKNMNNNNRHNQNTRSETSHFSIAAALASSTEKTPQQQQIQQQFQLQTLIAHLAQWISHHRSMRLHERLWVRAAEALRRHIRLVRNTRKDILDEGAHHPHPHPGLVDGLPASPRHLDDFNDYAADAADAAEDVNDRIALRIAALGLMHPAVGKGKSHEQAYLRTLFDRLFHRIANLESSQFQLHPKTISFTPSSLLRILIRETSVCQIVWPLIQHYAMPLAINQIIADKAHRRVTVLRAIRAFRAQLDAAFSQFPPLFLLPSRSSTSINPAHLSITDKQRYADRLSKYVRRARSVVDVRAVRHEISRELKRRAEDSREDTSNTRSFEQMEELRKFIRTIEVLRVRLDRRLNTLNASPLSDPASQRQPKRIAMPMMASAQSRAVDNPARTDTELRPELSLREILDECANSIEENGQGTDSDVSGVALSDSTPGHPASVTADADAATATTVIPPIIPMIPKTPATGPVASGLHYFLNFLEQYDSGSGVVYLRFWLATERYRRLLWRLGGTMESRPSVSVAGSGINTGVEPLAPFVHDRLRKEAAKIYTVFLEQDIDISQPNDLFVEQSGPRIKLASHILEPLQRYIGMKTTRSPDTHPVSTTTDTHTSDTQDCQSIVSAQHAIQSKLASYFQMFLHSESFFAWSSERERARLAERDRVAEATSTLTYTTLHNAYSSVYSGSNGDVSQASSYPWTSTVVSNASATGVVTATQVPPTVSVVSSAASTTGGPIATSGSFNLASGSVLDAPLSMTTGSDTGLPPRAPGLQRSSPWRPILNNHHHLVYTNTTTNQQGAYLNDMASTSMLHDSRLNLSDTPVIEDARLHTFNQSALLWSLSRDLESAAARLLWPDVSLKTTPSATTTTMNSAAAVSAAAAAATATMTAVAAVAVNATTALTSITTGSTRSDKMPSRLPSFAVPQQSQHHQHHQHQQQQQQQPTTLFSILDASATDSEIVTLDELTMGGTADTSEYNDDVTVTTTGTTSNTRDVKEPDDDTELRSPGELLASVTRLQQIKDDVERTMLQADCVDLLLYRIRSHGKDTSSGIGSGLDSTATHDTSFAVKQQHHHAMALYLLEQTRDMLYLEMGELSRQRAKYESQEQREAIVPGQCSIRIYCTEEDDGSGVNNTDGGAGTNTLMSGVVGTAGDAIEGDRDSNRHRHRSKITYYHVQIDRVDQKTGWTVQRRYTDFESLHRKLRDVFPIVNEFEFPGKALGLFSRARQREIRRGRVLALERYLQRLVDNPSVCQSDHVRDFLSSSTLSRERRRPGLFRGPFDANAAAGGSGAGVDVNGNSGGSGSMRMPLATGLSFSPPSIHLSAASSMSALTTASSGGNHIHAVTRPPSMHAQHEYHHHQQQQTMSPHMSTKDAGGSLGRRSRNIAKTITQLASKPLRARLHAQDASGVSSSTETDTVSGFSSGVGGGGVPWTHHHHHSASQSGSSTPVANTNGGGSGSTSDATIKSSTMKSGTHRRNRITSFLDGSRRWRKSDAGVTHRPARSPSVSPTQMSSGRVTISSSNSSSHTSTTTMTGGGGVGALTAIIDEAMASAQTRVSTTSTSPTLRRGMHIDHHIMSVSGDSDGRVDAVVSFPVILSDDDAYRDDALKAGSDGFGEVVSSNGLSSMDDEDVDDENDVMEQQQHEIRSASHESQSEASSASVSDTQQQEVMQRRRHKRRHYRRRKDTVDESDGLGVDGKRDWRQGCDVDDMGHVSDSSRQQLQQVHDLSHVSEQSSVASHEGYSDSTGTTNSTTSDDEDGRGGRHCQRHGGGGGGDVDGNEDSLDVDDDGDDDDEDDDETIARIGAQRGSVLASNDTMTPAAGVSAGSGGIGIAQVTAADAEDATSCNTYSTGVPTTTDRDASMCSKNADVLTPNTKSNEIADRINLPEVQGEGIGERLAGVSSLSGSVPALSTTTANTSAADAAASAAAAAQNQTLSGALCALLMEAFDFRERGQWLRHNAAIRLLREIFGATDSPETRISSWLMGLVKDDSMTQLLAMLLAPADETGIAPDATVVMGKAHVPLSSQQQQQQQKQRRQQQQPQRGEHPGSDRRCGYKHMLDPSAGIGSGAFPSMVGAKPVSNNTTATPPQTLASTPSALRAHARAKLLAAWPGAFSRVLGDTATTQGVERLFELLQNETLNKHLLFTLLDVVVETVVEADSDDYI